MKKTNYKKGSVYLQGKEKFITVQAKCRNEVLRLLLKDGYYVEAFYNSVALGNRETENKYYKKCMAKALYGIAKYKNIGSYSSMDYDESEGSISRFYYFFETLEKEDLSILALNAMIGINDQLNDPFVDRLINNLAIDAVSIHEIFYDDLKFKPYPPVQKEVDTTVIDVVEEKKDSVDDTDGGFVSKYDKLREMRDEWDDAGSPENIDDEGLGKFYLNVFVDRDQDLIRDLFDLAETADEKNKEAIKAEESITKDMSYRELRKYRDKQRKKERKKGVRLGLDKVVYIDPEFFAVDERKGVKLVNSEKKQMDFVSSIKKNAEQADLNVEVLSPKLFDEGSTGELNDIGLLNSWMGEVLSHQKRSFDNEFIPLETEFMSGLEKKYGTTKFCYSGVFTYKSKKDNIGQVLLYSLICYPLFPLGVIYALVPKHTSLYYHYMCDTKNGKIVYDDVTELNIKMNTGDINSQMYDKMIQFKTAAE